MKYHRLSRWRLSAIVLALVSALLLHTTYAEEPALTTPAPQPSTASSTTANNATPSGEMQRQLFERLNAIRAEHGLPAFRYNVNLETAAQRHTNDMQRNALRSHRGSDGSMYYDRMVAAGYVPSERWGAANETIGWGNNLERQINWWMNSPVHRSIILSSQYTEIGVGYAGDPAQRWGHWWTVDYGNP